MSRGGTSRAEYGKAILKELSVELTAEFGKGFSRSNLQNMRKFYLSYSDRLTEKCQMPSSKLALIEKSQTPSDFLLDSRTLSVESDPLQNAKTFSSELN